MRLDKSSNPLGSSQNYQNERIDQVSMANVNDIELEMVEVGPGNKLKIKPITEVKRRQKSKEYLGWQAKTFNAEEQQIYHSKQTSTSK